MYNTLLKDRAPLFFIQTPSPHDVVMGMTIGLMENEETGFILELMQVREEKIRFRLLSRETYEIVTIDDRFKENLLYWQEYLETAFQEEKRQWDKTLSILPRDGWVIEAANIEERWVRVSLLLHVALPPIGVNQKPPHHRTLDTDE